MVRNPQWKNLPVNPENKILLDAGVPVTREEYENLRGELIALIAQPGPSLEERLIAATAWLDILRDFVKAASREKADRKEIFATFFHSMKATGYDQPLRIARKEKGSPLLQRMFFTLLLAYRKRPEKRLSNPGTLLFVIYHYSKAIYRVGALPLVPLEGKIPFSALKKIPAISASDQLAQGEQSWITKWLGNDWLLRGKTIRENYLYLLMYLSLSRWYTAAILRQNAGESLKTEDLKTAFQCIEDHYMNSKEFEILLEETPVLQGLVEKTFARTTTPMTLLRPPV